MKETLEERVYRLGVEHLSGNTPNGDTLEDVKDNPYFIRICKMVDAVMKEEREECAQLIESFGKINGVEPAAPILDVLANKIRLRSHQL